MGRRRGRGRAGPIVLFFFLGLWLSSEVRALGEAQELAAESDRQWRASRFPQALAAAEKELALRRKNPGRGDALLVESLLRCARLHRALAELDRAEERYGEAVILREEAFADGLVGPLEVAEVLAEAADLHRYCGDYRAVEPLLERALEVARTADPPEEPESRRRRAAFDHFAGLSSRDLGDYATGQKLLERARGERATLAAVSGGSAGEASAVPWETVALGRTLRELTFTLRIQAEFAAARASGETAVAIFDETLGAGHPESALARVHLAQVLLEMVDLAAAGALLVEAHAALESSLGADHPETALALGDLAALQLSELRYDEVERLSRQALEILDEVWPHHLRRGHVLFYLAQALLAGQTPSAAKAPLEEARSLYSAAFGSDHPVHVGLLGQIAQERYVAGDLEASEAALDEALRLAGSALRPGHTLTAGIQLQLGSIYLARGDVAEAAPLVNQCTGALRQAFGADHPGVSGCLTLLASVALGQGRFEEAAALYERIHRVEKQAYGPDHPLVGQALLNLAFVAETHADLEQALERTRQAEDIFRRRLGEHHDLVAQVHRVRAGIFTKQGHVDRALTDLEQALGMVVSRNGPEALGLTHDLQQRSNLFSLAGDGQRAREDLVRALRIRRGALVGDHPWIVQSLISLGQLDARQRRYAEAGERLEEALRLQRERSAKDAARKPFDRAVRERRESQEAFLLQELGGARSGEGRFPEAQQALEAAVKLLERQPVTVRTGVALSQVAALRRLAGDLEGTREGLLRSLEILDGLPGAELQATLVRIDLGILELSRGELEAARGHIQQAFGAYRKDSRSGAWLAMRSLRAMGLLRQGEYRLKESLGFLEEALHSCEELGAVGHSELPSLLISLGGVQWALGQPELAEQSWRRALTASEASFGPRHRTLLDPLTRLASLALHRGQFAEARELAGRARDIAEETYGSESPVLAPVRLQVGAIHLAGGARERARIEVAAALEILERRFGGESPQLINALAALAGLELQEQNYVEAVSLYSRALEIVRKSLGVEHRSASGLAYQLASAWLLMGSPAAGEEILRNALTDLEGELDPGHPAVVEALVALASYRSYQGRHAAAIRDLERAEVLLESSLDDDGAEQDRSRASRLLSVRLFQGSLRQRTGDFVTARSLLEQALEQARDLFGPSHSTIAQIVSELFTLALHQGDSRRAFRMGAEAFRIWEATFPAQVAKLSKDFQEVAIEVVSSGSTKGFGPFLEVMVEQVEAASSHPNVQLAQALANLGLYKRLDGDVETAASLLNRSLQMLETALPREHPLLVPTLRQRSLVRLALGEHGGALEDQRRVEGILERTMDPEHPELVEARLAEGLLVWLVEDDLAAAGERFRTATEAQLEHLRKVLPHLAFSEQLMVGETLGNARSLLLESHLRGALDEDVLSLVMEAKGLAIENLRSETAMARLARHRRDLRPEYRELLNLRRRYARSTDSPEAPALSFEIEGLERRLRGELPEVELSIAPLRLAELRGQLGESGALVDLYRYDGLEKPGSDLEVFAEEQYAAILLGKTFGPHLVSLGAAEEIDAAIAEWTRDATTRSANVDRSWEAVRRALWAPLTAALPSPIERIWLSPDGETARVPWHLLAQERGLTQVTSARALLRLRSDGDASETGADPPSFLAVGNVDFRRTAVVGESAFEALEGSAAALRELREQAEEAGVASRTFSGAYATEAAVRAFLPRATWAHLATHGFFATESAAEEDFETGDFLQAASSLLERRPRNPLAESGLVFAGSISADEKGAPDGRWDEDGLLTAVDLLGIDCRRCEVVTLAACETGRGRLLTGQGVLGLQAALVSAGARNLVMSLWRIPDEAALAFSRAFYSAIWSEGLAPASALRKAQEDVRSRPEFAEPYFWAAWVLVGEGFFPSPPRAGSPKIKEEESR